MRKDAKEKIKEISYWFLSIYIDGVFDSTKRPYIKGIPLEDLKKRKEDSKVSEAK